MPHSTPEKRRAYDKKWRAKNREKERERLRLFYINNPGKKRQYAHRYYEANKEKHYAAVLKWQANNREKARAMCRRYRNSDVVRARERRKEWGKLNPDKNLALQRLRQARKLQATPPWLTQELKDEITKVYAEANRKGLVVDHIIPLRGVGVCGLHVHWNLQLLSKEENLRKGNRL